jgi:hypothetical protein
METDNFLLNSGTLLWMIFLWMFLVLVFFILKFISFFTIKLAKVETYIKSIIYFSLIIRILLESYVDLFLTSLLNLSDISWS